MSFKTKGRVNTDDYEIQKRHPPKATGTLKSPPNCIYVTKKTIIEPQTKKIVDLLDKKFDQVEIHGLGASLNRALVLALEVQKALQGTVQLHMTTSTVQEMTRNNGRLLYISYFVRNFRLHSTGPKVAVIGSGPAGLFTCASLLRKSNARIDVFDAAPVPFGLVRYGVAPDHQEVKNCINGFNKIFESNRDRISLFCNVRVSKDVSFEEVRTSYDAILLAYGAHKPRLLQLDGAESTNVFSGSDFVSWYNGVPNAKVPMLDGTDVVVIGNGNVALDCARVLSAGASASSSLKSTDVSLQDLNLLEHSKVKNITIVGRRAAENVSFTVKELREAFRVPGWFTSVGLSAEELSSLRDVIKTGDRRRRRTLQVLLDGVGENSGDRSCRFKFHRVPKKVLADSSGRVSALRVLNTLTNEEEEIDAQLLIYSIGYETIVLKGVPKNEKGMIDMADECRVRMSDPEAGARVYAAGWCAHGPKGVIVDTQQQAAFVAEQMTNDLAGTNTNAPGIGALLKERGVGYISWEDWKRMDQEETRQGHEKGKVREKITRFDGYLKKNL